MSCPWIRIEERDIGKDFPLLRPSPVQKEMTKPPKKEDTMTRTNKHISNTSSIGKESRSNVSSTSKVCQKIIGMYPQPEKKERQELSLLQVKPGHSMTSRRTSSTHGHETVKPLVSRWDYISFRKRNIGERDSKGREGGILRTRDRGSVTANRSSGYPVTDKLI
jgi:hypothetical protein